MVKETNKIIGLQYSSAEGKLIQDAISKGYKSGDIEEKYISDNDFRKIKSSIPINVITKAAIVSREIKNKTINGNLPSWAEVEKGIDNAKTIQDLQKIIKKMARVIYWLAKDKED
jgi:hypothetical protein